MRITTQMLNEAARKAGIPVHTTSMLNYVFNKDKTNALPFERNMEAEIESPRRQQNYEKQEDAARRLNAAAKELSGDGGESIYDVADTTENKEELGEKAEELVKQYNAVLETFSGSSGLLDSFYRKSLKSLVEEHEKQLSAAGITAGKNGKLFIDERKWAAADRETVKKAFSGKDGFADSLSFLSEKIADYASSNQTSAGALYQKDGSEAAAMRYTKNRYDAWG